MTVGGFTCLLCGWCCSALLLVACTGSCGRTHLDKHERSSAAGAGPTRRLDYAPFMKASGDTIAAVLARHLGVAPPTLLRQDGGSPTAGGNDRDVYAVADGGTIDLHFDRGGHPLRVQYRAAAGCLSKSGSPEKPIAPAAANAAVLALLRRMEIPVDDTVEVESQLHDDGLVWLGVFVWQTYQGEVIERPSVFAIVDGISNRVCEMRIPRWYAGLDVLGPPLAREALAARARAQGAPLATGQSPGQPTLRSLRILGDTLCREVKLAGHPELTLCLDIVTGNEVAAP
jgi:hypothetical protein